MSRIGKRKLTVPQNVQVTVAGNEVLVKGPLGQITIPYLPQIGVKVENGVVETLEEEVTKQSRALWGLYNALINNAMLGVTQGFEKKLELTGVGYRVKQQDKGISMTLGFSHPIEYNAPEGIELAVEDQTNLTVKGVDRALVGQVAAKIRSFRKPEPYKGKGVKYKNEVVRRKAGKAGKGAK
jgi:large subunit ribosomal protein L6